MSTNAPRKMWPIPALEEVPDIGLRAAAEMGKQFVNGETFGCYLLIGATSNGPVEAVDDVWMSVMQRRVTDLDKIASSLKTHAGAGYAHLFDWDEDKHETLLQLNVNGAGYAVYRADLDAFISCAGIDGYVERYGLTFKRVRKAS